MHVVGAARECLIGAPLAGTRHVIVVAVPSTREIRGLIRGRRGWDSLDRVSIDGVCCAIPAATMRGEQRLGSRRARARRLLTLLQ